MALNTFPIGTRVYKDFIDRRGDVCTFIGEVTGFRAPYWQVRCTDGNWEDVGTRETTKLVEWGRKIKEQRDGTYMVSSKNAEYIR